MSCQPFDELVAPLRRLQVILESEAVALQSLDFPGIDAAATAKDELATQLAAAVAGQGVDLSDDQQRAVATLRQDISNLARANHLRLRATLETVEGMVTAMTGTASNTYGRNARPRLGTGSQAVLTTEMG